MKLLKAKLKISKKIFAFLSIASLGALYLLTHSKLAWSPDATVGTAHNIEDIKSELVWQSHCVYKAKNFCVLPGADSGVLLFSESGDVKRAHREIPGLTSRGILLCVESNYGFLNALISNSGHKEMHMFQKLLSNRSAHVVNSKASVMPSHLVYTFPAAFAETTGSVDYDVYFTAGGARLKNHMQRSHLSELLDPRKQFVKTNLETQFSEAHSKSNSTYILGSVFSNFVVKDTLKWGEVQCYKEGIIGKSVAISGETFLPPFVEFSWDRDEQLKKLRRLVQFPFQPQTLRNTVDQKTAQEYRNSLIQKLGVVPYSSTSRTVVFALRKKDRKILNIENLIDIARNHELNVKSVYMDDLNITEQIRHGLSADILMGPEGSNLWITFWQEKFKALVIFQNPLACIARCEWLTSLSNGSHPLYYTPSASGFWSRIAWWSEVHSFVIDTRKCLTNFSMRSEEDRKKARIFTSLERRRSYKVDEVNFKKVLNLALKSLQPSNKVI